VAITLLAEQRGEDIQVALLAEAMDLLAEADHQVISSRMRNWHPDALAAELELGMFAPGTASAFALAIDRLSERLAWLVLREGLGYSPKERAALGRIRFLGLGTQEVASNLNLPPEAVTYWVRRESMGA
jgi:hypothetical protein